MSKLTNSITKENRRLEADKKFADTAAKRYLRLTIEAITDGDYKTAKGYYKNAEQFISEASAYQSQLDARPDVNKKPSKKAGGLRIAIS